MRSIALVALMTALLVLPSAGAEHARLEWRHYYELWPVEETAYLLAEVADGALVCTPVGAEALRLTARSLGGVCFEAHEGDTVVTFQAYSTLLGGVDAPPTFVLRFEDAEGALLRTYSTCQVQGQDHAIPAGTARVMALAIDGSTPGCPESAAISGSVLARFR